LFLYKHLFKSICQPRSVSCPQKKKPVSPTGPLRFTQRLRSARSNLYFIEIASIRSTLEITYDPEDQLERMSGLSRFLEAFLGAPDPYRLADPDPKVKRMIQDGAYNAPLLRLAAVLQLGFRANEPAVADPELDVFQISSPPAFVSIARAAASCASRSWARSIECRPAVCAASRPSTRRRFFRSIRCRRARRAS